MGNFLTRSDNSNKKNGNKSVSDETRNQRNTAQTVSSGQPVAQQNLVKVLPNHETPTEEELLKVRSKLKPISKNENTNATSTGKNKKQLTLRTKNGGMETETNAVTPEMENAVIKIQAGIRGYLSRKHQKEMRNDNNRQLNALN